MTQAPARAATGPRTLPAPSGVRAAFTGRGDAGSSVVTGNASLRVGIDARQEVLWTRARLADAVGLGSEGVAWAEQVHGAGRRRAGAR